MYFWFNILVHTNNKSQHFPITPVEDDEGKHTASNYCFINWERPRPIKLVRVIDHAQNYPDYHFLTQEFNHGFKLNYLRPRLHRSSKHSPSLGKRFSGAEQKIDREILLGSVAGPFMQLPIPTLQGFSFRFCAPKRWQISSYLPFLLSQSCFYI